MKFLKVSGLMAVMLFSAVMMLGILSLSGLPVRGGDRGAVPTTTVNGDVNCDGKRNITDAVALLQYIFMRGPEPCAVAQEASNQDLLDQMKLLTARLSPKRENMINLSSSGLSKDPPHTAYTVPEGKIFILTNFGLGLESGTGEVWEDTGGAMTRKWHSISNVPFASSLGLPFSPGSKVVLKLDTNRCSPRCPVDYTLVGYLIDA